VEKHESKGLNKTSCGGVPAGWIPEEEFQDRLKKEQTEAICYQKYFNNAIGL